jgi:hypothetical protein
MKSPQRIARFALSAALAAPLVHAQGLPPICQVPVVWNAPIDLGTTLRDDVPAAVAASENGEAMVAWFGSSPSGARVVQTRRYARVQSLRPVWQPAVAIETLKLPFEPSGVSVTMDATGNALATWESGDHQVEVARFTRATNGTGQWSTPTVLSAAGTTASAPVVALRSDGKVGLALWQTIEANRRALHWASYDASSGIWSPASTALAIGAHEDLAPAIAFTADGFALLAYQYITGTDTATTKRRVRVFGHWFDPSSHTWSKAKSLSDADGTNTPWKPPLVPQPRVTLDGGGQGLAAWRYRDPLGGCEEVRATNFDGASRSWSSVTQEVSGCIDPVPGAPNSMLPGTSNVLAAAIAPLNARTTFLLWGQYGEVGATLISRVRANASAPWEPRLQVPQPVVGHSISIGDAGFAGSSHPSALWVQPRGIGLNSGYGLYASNYSPVADACTARWSAAQKIADVTRLTPLLRTPQRAAVPIAVWIERVGDTPHVFATLRGAGLVGL